MKTWKINFLKRGGIIKALNAIPKGFPLITMGDLIQHDTMESQKRLNILDELLLKLQQDLYNNFIKYLAELEAKKYNISVNNNASTYNDLLTNIKNYLQNNPKFESVNNDLQKDKAKGITGYRYYYKNGIRKSEPIYGN